MKRLLLVLMFFAALFLLPGALAATGDVQIVLQDDGLYCYAEGYNDIETAVYWYVENNLVDDYQENPFLPSSQFDVNDEVRCDVWYVGIEEIFLGSATIVIEETEGPVVPIYSEIDVIDIPDAAYATFPDQTFNVCSTPAPRPQNRNIRLGDYVRLSDGTKPDTDSILWEVSPSTTSSAIPLVTARMVDSGEDVLILHLTPYAISSEATGSANFIIHGLVPGVPAPVLTAIHVHVVKDCTTSVDAVPEISLPDGITLTMTSADHTVLQTFTLDDFVTDDHALSELTWDIDVLADPLVAVTYYPQEHPISFDLPFFFPGFTIPITITLPARTAILSVIPEANTHPAQETIVRFTATDIAGNTAVHMMRVVVVNPFAEGGPLDGGTGLDRDDKVKFGENEMGNSIRDFSIARIQPLPWKASYTPNERIQLLLKIENKGVVDQHMDLTIYSPTMSLQETHVQVGVDEASTKWTQAIVSIPANAQPGWHVLRVIATNTHGDSTSSYWRFLVA